MRTTSGNDWIWLTTRWSIYARDDFRCLACASSKSLSLDHVVRGGPSNHTNLVTLCKACNSSKGVHTFRRWRPELVDAVLLALANPIDRRLGRELGKEFRPSRLAAAEFRLSSEERSRRRAARAALESAVIDTFADFVRSEEAHNDLARAS